MQPILGCKVGSVLENPVVSYAMLINLTDKIHDYLLDTETSFTKLEHSIKTEG